MVFICQSHQRYRRLYNKKSTQKINKLRLDFSESPPTIFWTPIYVRCISKSMVKEDEKTVEEAHNIGNSNRGERKKDKRAGVS